MQTTDEPKQTRLPTGQPLEKTVMEIAKKYYQFHKIGPRDSCVQLSEKKQILPIEERIDRLLQRKSAKSASTYQNRTKTVAQLARLKQLQSQVAAIKEMNEKYGASIPFSYQVNNDRRLNEITEELTLMGGKTGKYNSQKHYVSSKAKRKRDSFMKGAKWEMPNTSQFQSQYPTQQPIIINTSAPEKKQDSGLGGILSAVGPMLPLLLGAKKKSKTSM